MSYSIFAIISGAGIGALLRWFLGLKFNNVYSTIPLGTLSANIIGGYLIGFFIAFFAQNATLSPEWRLLIITGFLGGLTTFSTFSAEMVSLLQQNNYQSFITGLVAHVGGSLIMTILGIFTFKFFN